MVQPSSSFEAISTNSSDIALRGNEMNPVDM